MRTVQAGPITSLIAQVLLLAGLAGTVGLSGVGLNPAGWVVGVTCGVITNAAVTRGLSRYRADRLGPADWITLARAILAVGVAALVADSFDQRAPVAVLVSLAALALALDAVDGWVARRTRTTATFGAQFDGEVDAFLILILSVYVARSAGAWVLAIGAARYAFLAAGWPLSWIRAPLPPRYWRKVVAATQGIVLTIAAADILPPALTKAALVVALALLAESFGGDVWWLWGHRHGTSPQPAAVAGPDSLPGGIVGDVHRGVSHGSEVSDVNRALRAVAWERFAGQVVQALLTLVVLLALPSPVRSSMPVVVIAVVASVLAVVLVARARPGDPRSEWARVRRIVAGDIRDGLLARRAWLGIVLASAVVVIGHAATFLIAARTAGIAAPPSRMLPLALLVMLIMVLPSVGGWGPREGATAWAFGAAGLGAQHGVTTAVVYGVMVLVASLPGAAVLVVAWLRRTPPPARTEPPLRERAAHA